MATDIYAVIEETSDSPAIAVTTDLQEAYKIQQIADALFKPAKVYRLRPGVMYSHLQDLVEAREGEA